MLSNSTKENPWITVHEMTVDECRQSGDMSDSVSTMESLIEDENGSDDLTRECIAELDMPGRNSVGCSCRRVPPIVANEDTNPLESTINNFSLSLASCAVQNLPIPRNHIPRHEDVLQSHILRELFPHMFDGAAETVIVEWIEICEQSSSKDYESGSSGTIQSPNSTGVTANENDDDEHHNQQNASSIPNMTDTANRQNTTVRKNQEIDQTENVRKQNENAQKSPKNE